MSATLEALIHSDYRTSSWSGGTTTELAIYPAGANYNPGNFQWRLSTATVEDEMSTFSVLPGISRTLMVLEGHMVLRHEGHHAASLGPYDQDRFDGGWTTHSRGRARDFNLMCADGVEGDLATFRIPGRDTCFESVEAVSTGLAWLALYCVDGDMILCDRSDRAHLRTGQLLLAEASRLAPGLRIENLRDQTGVLIRCSIRTR